MAYKAGKFDEERECFRLWVVEDYSVRQLVSQSEHSSRKLYRMINYQLKQPAPQPVLGLEQCQHFIFDGTFLHRPRSLIALMDARTHMLVAGQYDVSENSEPSVAGIL